MVRCRDEKPPEVDHVARHTGISLRLFVLGVVCIAIGLGFGAYKTAQHSGTHGAGIFMIIGIVLGILPASLAWLVSCVYGLMAVKARPYVLAWVIPELLYFGHISVRWLMAQ